MNHLSRLLSILTILKSKRIVTGNELAQKFDVSLRTIYRDIRKLEDSGVPVITIEGKGYSILDGYTVAPVMFEEKEVNAIVTAEKLIAKTNDESLIQNFDQFLTKIKSVFKTSLQEKSEFLKDKMMVIQNNSFEKRSNSLSALQSAIINLRITEIDYVDKKLDNTFRKIEPAAIYCFDELWIVVAWCRLRDDFRTFRLDRIKKFRVLEEQFENRNFDLREYFLSCEEIETGPLENQSKN